jgi:NTE family protein
MEEALENIKNKTALVLSGGGVLGMGEAGSLVRLEEIGLPLKNFKSVSGSSVGSIIGLGIACGADSEYIEKKMREVNLSELENKQCFLIEGFRLINNFGLRKICGVRKFVTSILTDLGYKTNITFKELYDKTGVWLTVTYLSLNYERTIYADHVYEPNSSVLETVIKSTAIPVFYEAYFETKNKIKEVCVDGGIQLNFPMIVPRLQKVDPKEIIGLKFISSGDVHVKDEGQPGTPEEDNGPPKNIVNFLTTIVNILRKQAMKVHVSKNDWKLTVKINVGTMSSTNFDLTEVEKEWLFSQGKYAVDKYIEELTNLIETDDF